ARTTPEGDLVRLADQDRSLWNRELIAEGLLCLREALERQQLGLSLVKIGSRQLSVDFHPKRATSNRITASTSVSAAASTGRGWSIAAARDTLGSGGSRRASACPQ